MKQFNEQEHPRASDGKFTSKGGESSNPKDLQKDVEVKESSNKKMGQNDIESKAYEMLKGGAKEEDVVAWLEEQDPEADFYEMKDYVSQLAGNLEDNGHESPRGLQKEVNEPAGHKHATRKDKYGNPLVSDEAFKVGVEAAKKVIEENKKYGDEHGKMKDSFVYQDQLKDAIRDAFEEKGLNPDYDLTYQDYNEMIGAATGEEVDFEVGESNWQKAWKNRPYIGYQPK